MVNRKILSIIKHKGRQKLQMEHEEAKVEGNIDKSMLKIILDRLRKI